MEEPEMTEELWNKWCGARIKTPLSKEMREALKTFGLDENGNPLSKSNKSRKHRNISADD